MSTGHYVVVLYAEAAARFDPEDYLALPSVPSAKGPANLIFRTDYVDEGFASPVPRSMWAEIYGPADSLDDALTSLGQVGFSFGPAIALAANAHVGDFEPHLAFDATSGRSERDFFQSFIDAPQGLPNSGRRVLVEGVGRLIQAYSASAHRERLDRATGQYALALSYWRPNLETLALAHLYMGMEALTPVAVRREANRRGVSESELQSTLGCDDGFALAAQIRKTVLFASDEQVYREARRASDAFEHGFENFDVIRDRAIRARDRTACLLRKAIIESSDVDPSICTRLLEPPYDTPKEWFGYKRYFRGKLLAERDELAAPDKQYPMLVLRQAMKRFERQADGRYEVDIETNLKALLGEGVQLKPGTIEMWGPGQDPPSEPGNE